MTTAVGIETPEGVYIGADTWVSNEDGTGFNGAIKAWEHGPLVLGFAGPIMLCHAIAYRLNILTVPEGTLHSWALIKLREYLGKTLTHKERKVGDWNLLIGYGAELVCLDSDGTVTQSLNQSQAIGTGAPFALGSLATTAAINSTIESPISPEGRIQLAIASAALHCNSTRLPISIVHTKVAPILRIVPNDDPSTA